MLGRPKKALDIDKILKLHSQGKSSRQIAKEFGVGKDTINRVLRQAHGGAKVVAQKSSIGVECKSMVSKNDKTSENLISSKILPTNNTPSSRSEKPNYHIELDAHHIAYSIAYIGKQPTSLQRFTLSHSYFYKFEIRDANILVHTKRIIIWLNQELGNSPKEIQDAARGRIRSILAEFASAYDLKLNWEQFEQKALPHYTLTNEAINTFLFNLFSIDEDKAGKLGIDVGDSSHPNNVEFTGKKGEETLNRLEKLLEQDPKQQEIERAKLAFLYDMVVSLAESQEKMLKMQNKQLEHSKTFEDYTHNNFVAMSDTVRIITEVLGEKQGLKPKHT